MTMNDIQFIGCPHIGHKGQAVRRGFSSIEEMNEEIIKRFNENAGKKTLSIILGDVVVFNKTAFDQLERLNGRKIFVLGNHDTRGCIPELLKYGEVQGAFEYKNTICTHIPIHRDCLERYAINIHSHMHEEVVRKMEYKPLEILAKRLVDHRYLNVNWDILQGKPVSLQEVIKYIEEHK